MPDAYLRNGIMVQPMENIPSDTYHTMTAVWNPTIRENQTVQKPLTMPANTRVSFRLTLTDTSAILANNTPYTRGDDMTTSRTYSMEDDDAARSTRIFSDWINGIQRQIDQMNEQISNTYATARYANIGVSGCEERISKLEHEREATTASTQTTPCLPDSNGFWRDEDGDIWAYDGNPDHNPIYLFDNGLQIVCDSQPEDPFSWELIKLYAPFTKISNPFPEGDHHAD